jgi:hypothetical protein
VFVSSLQAVTRPPHTYIYPCHIFHVPDNVYTVFFLSICTSASRRFKKTGRDLAFRECMHIIICSDM